MNAGKVIKYTNEEGDEKTLIITERIGQGSYGIVFKAVLEGYGFIAVKMQHYSPSVIRSVATEMRIANVLPKTVGITLRRVLLNPLQGRQAAYVAVSNDVPLNIILTLFDFADGLELLKLTSLNALAKIKITENEVEKYIKDFLTCLEGLQKAGIAHRDIKPENLILDKGNILLIDFGLACFYKECKGKKGTFEYLPPEFFLLPEIDWQKGDIFAMGITIISMITNGESLYENHFRDFSQAPSYFSLHTHEMLEQKFGKTIDEYSKTFPVILQYKELIMGMINPSPEKRWTVKQCFDWLEGRMFAEVIDLIS